MSPIQVNHSYLTLPDNTRIFYRHAGPPNAPLILLLHGYPSSSHQFRTLIPHLATKGYRIIAPDLPGFGFTTTPASQTQPLTFSSLTTTLLTFITTLSLPPFALYVFDYGAPVGLRLALQQPTLIKALITQNGNAYVDGLSPTFWAPLQSFWTTANTAPDRQKLHDFVTLPFTKWQYLTGEPDPDAVPPEAYTLDQALLDRPGNKEVQLDLFYDYRTNVAMYPLFQRYLRESSGTPVLVVWGKGDECFVKEGAEAYRRDVQGDRLEVKWLEAGHFALEAGDNAQIVAGWIEEFLVKKGVFGEEEK